VDRVPASVSALAGGDDAGRLIDQTAGAGDRTILVEAAWRLAPGRQRRGWPADRRRRRAERHRGPGRHP